MKKIIKIVKNNILGIVIGVLLGLTLDVAAEALIDSGAVTYSNSKTSETTVDGALDELFSAIDISKQIGTTDISSIGDGTITSAINTLNSNLDVVSSAVSNLNNKISLETINTSVTNDSSGTLINDIYTATKNCYVIVTIRPYTGNGFTELNIVSYSANDTWLADQAKVLSPSRELMSITCIAYLSAGEKLKLVGKNGVANETMSIFGRIMVVNA